ncbi:MAG: hypothetical protein AAF386_08270 [Pseudomonadota bacterium]
MFIIAVGAGFATPYAEPHLQKFMKSVLSDDVPMAEGEFRTFTFVMLMLAVSLLAFGSNISAFAVILGGGLGLFGLRIFNALKSRVSGKKDDAVQAAEDVVEAAKDDS